MRLDYTRHQAHPGCFFCSPRNAHGLLACFTVAPDGAVEATLEPAAFWEGYPGYVHGGLVASLLDAAMTHALFARDCPGLTAELRVRYHFPVLTSLPVLVRARHLRAAHGLHLLEAELVQGRRVKVTASAKFMNLRPQPDSASTPR